MPKAFLNHKSQEKKVVKSIQQYLNASLIPTWLDEEQLRPGENLLNSIYNGVSDNDFFVAFISERYLDSAWCIRELDTAEINKGIHIIPVIIGDDKLIMEKANPRIKSLLQRHKYVVLNEYDLQETAQQIIEAIQKKSTIWFDQVQDLQVDGIDLKLIEMNTIPDIPTDYFKRWDFNIEDFLEVYPLQGDSAIAFFGKGPSWLYSFLTIPLFNKRNTFVYNFSSKGFVCTYAIRANKNMLGTFLPYSKNNQS